MVELRWGTRSDSLPVLQYRQERKLYTAGTETYTVWTDWQDVPSVQEAIHAPQCVPTSKGKATP